MRLLQILRAAGGSGKVMNQKVVASPTVIAEVAIESKAKTVFKKLFGKYLIVTNTLSAGLLMGIGDWAAQEAEYRAKETRRRYDWKRGGQMFLVGCLSGPPHHFFYKYLDKLIPRANLKAVCQKIMVDQLVFSPFCIFTFFYGAGLMEDKSLGECTTEIRQKFMTVYKADWIIWPSVQFVNFYFLPPHFRVIYVNVITTLYNVFLSHVKHKAEVKPKCDE